VEKIVDFREEVGETFEKIRMEYAKQGEQT
jgi:hypothetical protein